MVYGWGNWQLNAKTDSSISKMIEPELAFADLDDDMACATAYLQYVVCYFSYLFQTFMQQLFFALVLFCCWFFYIGLVN